MTLLSSGLAAVAAAPLVPDRDRARQWAADELSSPEYQAQQPSLTQRLLGWLVDRIEQALANLPSGPGSRTALAVLVVVLVLVVGYALYRVGGLRLQGSGSGQAAVFEGGPAPAATHRAAADTAAAAGDHRTAVLERFRAVARELEERAVLTPQPGRTADEVSREAASWLPDLAGLLARGAEAFDDVRYGDRAATAATDTLLRTLDDGVRATRPLVAPRPAIHDLVAPS